MQHHFDVELAQKYGVAEAILLDHFEYWIELNRENEKNFYDGRYWTFNSMKAFSKIFPYMTEKKIRNALKHLQDEGLIVTGNYNKLAYDRTLWYAFSDLAESILPKGQMEIPERANGYFQKVEPIPDNKPDNDTDIYTRESKDSLVCASRCASDDGFAAFWAAYPKKKSKGQALSAWKKLKPDSSLQALILKAVEAQKRSPDWQKDKGKYIPYPATWLNAMAWEDEVPAEQKRREVQYLP